MRDGEKQPTHLLLCFMGSKGQVSVFSQDILATFTPYDTIITQLLLVNEHLATLVPPGSSNSAKLMITYFKMDNTSVEM